MKVTYTDFRCKYCNSENIIKYGKFRRTLPEGERGSYLRARGAVPALVSVKPEETIRRLRDA